MQPFVMLINLRLKYFIVILCLLSQLGYSSDSLSVLKRRKVLLGISSVGIASTSLVYLNQAWYQQYNSSKFHTFNDNEEWFQMDKYGHTFTTYQTARLMMGAMDWAGYHKKKQLLIGGMSGFAYMSAIEIMDGYSDGWGFSWGDMAANSLGSGLAIGQKIWWNEQRIQLKYSFRKSEYAQYRTNLLGKSFSEEILKDYNGQTYWLSVNPSAFMKKESKFPKWLNVAFGYGGDGMIGAFYNNVVVMDENGNTKEFNRYRQYYFSLDADLTRIKTKSKFLKSVFSCINIIKIPFPNMELSEGKLKFNAY
jgi:hypothetical protein